MHEAMKPDMHDRIADRAPIATVLVFVPSALLASALLAGCSASGGNHVALFADPGKYRYSSCQHLADQRKTLSAREQELKLLMDKAEQSAGGALVNVFAYKADYIAATEDLQLVETAARSKNCATPETWGSNSAVR
jgi:hypothetical protein